MRTYRHCVLVGILVGTTLGCNKKKDESEPPRPDPVPNVTPPVQSAPGPGASGASVVEKETEALKPYNVVLFPSPDGITPNINSESLTDGKLKPDLLALLKKTTTLIGLNFQFAPEFSDAGMEDLKGFTNLQTLHLGTAKVTDAGLVHLKGMKKLRELYLPLSTKITDAGLVHLEALSALT